MREEEDEAPNNDNICNEIMSIRGKDDATNNDLLQFCEEEVMSCPTGRWGYNMNSLGSCVYDCDKCRNISETCRVSDGHCFSECKEGLWGGSCNQACNCVDVHLAGNRMDTVKTDARKDSGEEAATRLVIVWMIHLADSQMDTVIADVRTGSGEEVVMNNVTVRMEHPVIRPMEHVRPVSLNTKFYFLFYLKTIGKFCFQCIVTKNAYLSDVPIIEDGNFLFIHFLIFPELSSTIKYHEI